MKRLQAVLAAVITLLTMVSFIAVPDTMAAQQSTMTKDRAKLLLSGLDPHIKIISLEKANVKGLWEVVIETRGKKGIVYLDESGRNLILGSIIDLITRTNITKEKMDEINRVDVSQIPLDDAVVMGDRKAKHKVIVFDDPD